MTSEEDSMEILRKIRFYVGYVFHKDTLYLFQHAVGT